MISPKSAWWGEQGPFRYHRQRDFDAIAAYNIAVMPVTAEIDRVARLVLTTASGVLTKGDFIDHIEHTWRDESIASFDEIVDATQADASGLSAQDLADIVNSGVVYDPADEPRLALCVSSDLAYGIGRMFSSMRESHIDNGREIRVFRTVEEAREWLVERSP